MVWVVFLNHWSAMSWNRIASRIGGRNPNRMRSRLISKVLRITRTMPGWLKISTKLPRPTHSLPHTPRPMLRSVNETTSDSPIGQ